MKTMAGVLAEHQLNVHTNNGDAWSPPEEDATCSCGAEIGGWVASGADWSWPEGWGREHSEHVADVLSTAGFGFIDTALTTPGEPMNEDSCCCGGMGCGL